MERRAAVISASVISASVLAASAAMAVAGGLFDTPSGAAEPDPVATSTAPGDLQTASTMLEPEVVTVVVDDPGIAAGAGQGPSRPPELPSLAGGPPPTLGAGSTTPTWDDEDRADDRRRPRDDDDRDDEDDDRDDDDGDDDDDD